MYLLVAISSYILINTLNLIIASSVTNSTLNYSENVRTFPAFIINLSKDTERMVKLKPQLDNLKIPYKLFEAIDGAAVRRFGAIQKLNFLTGAELEKHNPHLDHEIKYDINDQNRRTGEIGCWLSHLKLLLDISRSNITGPILILEDDAKFTPEFLPTSISLINQLPSNWDSLRVGFCPYKSYSTCKSSTGQILSNTTFCKLHKRLAGAHAYFVNGHLAARKIFDQLNSVKGLIVDFSMNCNNGVEHYASHIKIVNQDHSFVSNLQNPRC